MRKSHTGLDEPVDPAPRVPARVNAHLRRQWHVWLVVALAAALAAPRLGYLLPALVDHTDEIYQPFQALKFAATKGQAFHKYGPVPNFVLLPAYAATFAWWRVTGRFGTPETDYPFGLAQPIGQMGVLVFEARLIYLVLGLVALAAATAATHRLTQNRAASAAAALLMVVTCYRFQWALPTPSVDASMTAFLLLALAVWLRMACDGPTPWRGAAFATAAALAVGSKENAVVPLTAMALALVVWSVRNGRQHTTTRERASLWRSVVAAATVGLTVYIATNVLYAPDVWWERMRYWTGPGVSGDIWGRNVSWTLHLRLVGAAALNNLGPAAAVIAPVAVFAACWSRPKWSALLVVPPAAALAPALALPYSTDRFVTPAVVTLMPLVALGLAHLLVSLTRHGRTFATLALTAAVAVNLLWSSVVFHLSDLTEQALLERDLQRQPPGKLIGYGVMHGDSPAMRRAAYLGHQVDLRAMQEWPADWAAGRALPHVVYIRAGRVQMLDEARRMPGRAAHYAIEKGFDLGAWPGFEALGYGSPRIIDVPWPARLAPLRWMPLVRDLRHQQMLAFERPHALPPPPNLR